MTDAPQPTRVPGHGLVRSATLGRRQFLAGTAVAVAGATVLGDTRPGSAATVGADPFLLGVASGDPLPDSVVLWTRLVRDLFEPASIGSLAIPVQWLTAEDAACTRVVRRGLTTARPELAHSVHVDVRGLRPDTVYFYRFRAAGHLSPTGTTRTAPAAGASLSSLRVGVVNCQDWQNGYWPAYSNLAEEDLDVVFHLGDYIYEYDPASAYPDRMHNPPAVLGLDQLQTLTDFRNRQALYKSDPAIQLAHGRFPWVLTWDDHEVENNYATLIDEIDDTGAQRQSRSPSPGSGPGPIRLITSTCRSARPYCLVRPATRSTARSTTATCSGWPCWTPGSTARISRGVCPATSDRSKLDGPTSTVP